MDSAMTAKDIEALKQEAAKANAHLESVREAAYDQGIHDSLGWARGKQGQPKNVFQYLWRNIVDDIKGPFKRDAAAASLDDIQRLEAARKAGYVQGVCECVAAIGDDHFLGKKLLTEMNVTREAAKKYANPETFKALEQGIFAPPEQERTLDMQQAQAQGRHR